MSDEKINLCIENKAEREVVFRLVKYQDDGAIVLEMKDSGSEEPHMWWTLLCIHDVGKNIWVDTGNELISTVVGKDSFADLIKR